MKKPFLIFLFFFSIFNFAQNSNYKNIATFSSISYFIGRVDVGLMHNLGNRFWLGAELGYGNGYGGFKNNLNSKSSNIFKISPEIYFDLDTNSSWLHLISVQLFYTKRIINGFEGDVYANNSYYKFTSADVDRTRQGLNINYSFLSNKDGKKFAIMPKLGLGVRYRNNKYSNFVGLQETFAEPDEDFFGVKDNNAVSDIDFNLNIDVKLIYRF